ncbi:MAG TPA: hypothetical protein VMN57_10385 [Anaerolineales bacterium]|nr:hypothetical protein [Anaerolineales bacterium]
MASKSRGKDRRMRLAAGCAFLGAILNGCAPPTAALVSPVDPFTPAAPVASPTPVIPLETVPAPTQPEDHPAAPQATRTPPANLYLSQPGDTFQVVAARFGGKPLDLRCYEPVETFCPPADAGAEAGIGFDPNRLLPTGTALWIPPGLDVHGPAVRLLPDSEIIFSAAARDFNVTAYLEEAGGFLAGHRQYLMLNAWNTAADIVDLVSIENSANPRLLLALLEYQCRCVLGPAENPEPYLGADFTLRFDLYGQLIWGVHELSVGYYGWRLGTLTEVTLQDGSVVRLNPRLNAGTAALYRLFALLYDADGFRTALNPETGFPATFEAMFGDPWGRARVTIPDGAVQPPMTLPFEPGLVWSYTGGPHAAYEKNGPAAALDFAPASAEPGCQPTPAWVVAAADGLVVRSEYGLLIQDLDGDGDETTGWVIMYLHVGAEGRAEVGRYLQTGERLGQPSCEGGRALGTHLHIVRKLNGEWIAAGTGPLPFNLGGWIAVDGPAPYEGTLTRDGTVLIACVCSWRVSWITNE